MDVQTKHQFEDFQICVSFSDVLGTGEELNGAAADSSVKCYDEDGDETTATMISNISWSASQVSFFIGAGNKWERYTVKVKAETKNVANVQQFEKDIAVIGWALTTLDEVKSYISPAPSSSDYVLLLNLIAGATAAIERACLYPYDWHIVETKHTNELYDGTGASLLFLKQYPVILVNSIYNELEEIREIKWRTGTYTSTGITISSSLVDEFVWTDQDAWNEKGVEVRAPGSSTTKGVQWTTSNVGTKTTDYVVALTSNGWSNGTPSNSDLWRFDDGFKTNYRNGRLYYGAGWTKGHQKYIATYKAGYLVPPFDLNQLCNELVAKAYSERDKVGLESERIGNYSYKRFNKFIGDREQQIIAPYRLLNAG